ncbi:hypothetical protein HPB52_015986 [Rhipicephalus sanguineus]|uniref:Uncharacterized protein n=1 Tax=Rhipicephalus sanguineus TaxID=34632 RepID=A0A9D4TAR1_RHISA|nr:hypothetical protein HPB52_015986 [Rhipicephalus sanguineus]
MTGPTAGRPGGGRRGSAPLPVQRRASLSPQPPGVSAPTSLGPSPKQSPRPSIEGSPKESPPPAEQDGPPSPGGASTAQSATSALATLQDPAAAAAESKSPATEVPGVVNAVDFTPETTSNNSEALEES